MTVGSGLHEVLGAVVGGVFARSSAGDIALVLWGDPVEEDSLIPSLVGLGMRLQLLVPLFLLARGCNLCNWLLRESLVNSSTCQLTANE